MIVRILFCLGLFSLSLRAAESTSPWQPTQWNGESALVSSSHGWKAIVSLTRGRLVHFGPDSPDAPNLIFVPVSRDDPAGRGGHRVWEGPQSTWAQGWPPPDAWEKSAPESHAIENGGLRLAMPDAGAGWPRLTRTYRWEGARLVCGVELSGGTRPAQIIQIVQIPATSVVEVTAQPDAATPQGFVLLPSSATRKFTANFSPLPHVTRHENSLELRHVRVVAKAGFRPQALTGREGALTLTIRRGESHGRVTGEPDQGFSTQVYLGGPEPFIELEQLTALFAPDAPALFEIVLEGDGKGNEKR